MSMLDYTECTAQASIGSVGELVSGFEKFVTGEVGEDVALGGHWLSRVSSPRSK
jgi:hypothetical protein